MQIKEIKRSGLREILFERSPISEERGSRVSRIEWVDGGGRHIRTFTGTEEGRIKTVKENSFRLVGARRRDYDPETGRLASQTGEGYDPQNPRVNVSSYAVKSSHFSLILLIHLIPPRFSLI